MIKKLLPAFFLLFVCAVCAEAQPNPEQAVQKAREEFSDIKNRSIELERMKRDSYKRPANENLALNFPLIKEDFEEIQKINSNIFRLAAAKKPLKNATVFKLVSKINTRAVRLKSNLFADDSKSKTELKNKPQNIVEQDLKSLSDALDKAVNTFVHNAIFQNTNIVNLKDSLKAQKDLETVINISNAIKVITKS